MSGTRRGPVVAANWKMHLTRPEARALAERVVAGLTAPGGIRIVLIPPFTALADVGGVLAGTKVGLGAQNLYWEDKGAFTGEVSAPMLRDVGCTHVLVGHSERRRLFGETDEAVNRKVRAALNSDLSPIVCVGETLEEREGGRTTERIDTQLAAGLRALSGQEMERLILAYEPVWAIGTGKTASPAQAEEVHAHIRKRLEEAYGNDRASCAIILYGGSVKPANSYPLFREKNIDGFLVGGASLEADAFAGIIGEVLRADREET
jgi:triosephosphate isomerase